MIIYTKELTPESFSDMLNICSKNLLTDPLILKGIEMKEKWFREIFEEYGSPIRVCYVDGEPISQILYYPEDIVPYIKKPRVGVLRINCIYNPYREFQKLGCGKRLIYSIIEDLRNGLSLFKTFILS